MADPNVGILIWNVEAMQTLITGGLGGLFLALGRYARTTMSIDSPEPKKGQLLLAHLPIFLVLPILGGGLAYLTMGASGAFITGLGALGFILIVTGPHHEEARPAKGEPDASSNHQP